MRITINITSPTPVTPPSTAVAQLGRCLLDAMARYLAFFVAIVCLVSGCVATPPRDVRAALLASAEKGDPDFPDGREVVLTHFSHVGQLVTSSGDLIYVADRSAVIAGMPAPRGRNYITCFDSQFRYLGKVGYVASRPLWCDGSRLYLFGDLDGFATGLSGNVIDVAAGYEHLKAYHAPAYGSSGGVDDRDHESAAPVIYHNPRYDFTFSLPTGWRGYSVLVQQWQGQRYLPAGDKVVMTEHGPIIILRHPQWTTSNPYQDIPILVFTREQWEADKQGQFTIGAGGFDEEIGHNSQYVFAISSRFNAADAVKGCQEATDTVERNRVANEPHLHPE